MDSSVTVKPRTLSPTESCICTVVNKGPSDMSFMEELETERASAFPVRIAWPEGFA